jgi:hypothetical protein
MTLRLIRTWLPIVVVAVGVLLWAIDPSLDSAEGSAHIIGAGVAIWILNVLFRIGVSGDKERDEEDAAREFFDRHGYWPDDPRAQSQRAPSPGRD